MSALKLSMVASIYGKPYTKLDRWARTIAPPATATNTITTTPIAVKKSSLSQNRATERLSRTDGWRIMPCAHLAASAHDKGSSRNLGFRCAHRSLSSSPPNFSSSSEHRGEGSGGNVADMGSESQDAAVDWSENHRSSQRKQPQPPPVSSSSKLLTLPTVLTLGRVAAVPLLIGTFYVDSWWGTTTTTTIFIAAAITDWLDGYLARKMRLGTTFGAFLDPVADKLMVAATLVLLCSRPLEFGMFGPVPWLLTVPSIAIIGREITMSAVREWAASQNTELLEAVAVNNLGKWKTATQMTSLTVLLAARDSSLTAAGGLVASGVVLLYISAGLAVWSLVVYIRKIWKVLIK
ncbi:hypothetical protein AAG906_008246 [Vitis piasezkii]